MTRMNADQHKRNHPMRTRFFASLGSALIVVGSLLAADWPQLLGPTRDGKSTETGLLATWPKAGPPKVWDIEAGQGWAGPVVVGDRLVFFHRVADKEVVQCLDSATGKEKWKFDYATKYAGKIVTDAGPRSTPLVRGQVWTVGAEGMLHCLTLDAGKKVWAKDLIKDYKVPGSFFGVGSTPILEEDKLIVNVGGKDAGIVAFDAATGKELWKATGDPASYSSPTAATINGQRYIIFLTREGIVSLDPDNGKVRFSKRWRSKNPNSVNAATPLVIGGQLFVSACYDTGAILHRVTKDGLEEVWKGDDILSNHYNTSIHHEGFLYGIDGRQDIGVAQLRCVDLKTGKVRWTEKPFGCATMLFAEGRLIALNEEGELLLIEATPEGYKEKARAAVLTKPCRAGLALANGRLYARDPERLICWNLKK